VRFPFIFIIVFLFPLVTAAASPSAVDGVCGPANGVPTTMPPTSGLCSAGTPTAVTGTGPWFWNCKGLRHGNTASCYAPLSPPPPPTLTLTVMPMPPNISSSSPLGTVVASATAAWSNGAPFTGTIGFVSPNENDGGTFALSCTRCTTANLIISPLGMGVSGDGGTVQHVTLEANQ